MAMRLRLRQFLKNDVPAFRASFRALGWTEGHPTLGNDISANVFTD